MVLKQQLTACLKQTAQMERNAQSLGLAPSEQVRLVALLRSAKDALAEAEKMIPQEDGDEQQEAAAKLQLWERKLLDLSLRNNLLNMKLGKNAIRYEHDDIATLEDELDQGKEFILDQKELKGIYRAVRTNLEESGVNTLFLTFGTLHWNERSGGRKYAAPILLVPVEIVPINAQQGALKSAPSINSSEDSSLIVQQIAEALLRKGYEVKTNVGSSALRVDLAIIDPLHKDHYTLGIVLDGANYYHLKTTCDREIVQPSVLQMLGWRLMHVWTVDWLNHPENVITEIVTKIK